MISGRSKDFSGDRKSMSKLTLGFISAFNERVEPAHETGRFRRRNRTGFRLIPIPRRRSGATQVRRIRGWRRCRLSSFLIARSQGADMIALPVFSKPPFISNRAFLPRRFKGSRNPKTLPTNVWRGGGINKRLRFGSAAFWNNDFGVSQYKIHWYMERSEEMSHGAHWLQAPAGISFNRIAPNKSLASTLLKNEIDVAHVASPLGAPSECAGSFQSYRRQRRWSKIKPLFPDRMAEGARFYKGHGFLPVNHAYIIRGDIYKKYPWVAFNLYTGSSRPRHSPVRNCWSESRRRFFSRRSMLR